MSAAGSADGPNLARSWLSDVQCRGPEATVAECRGGEDFLTGAAECERASSFREATISNQLYVACRQFPVTEALEGEVTPGAGEHTSMTSAYIPLGGQIFSSLELRRRHGVA